MSYLVLARKYRPGTFHDVAGQEHVTRTLSHAIERDKVGHAFLFCGPRGVGKTSVARIFAKSLNCEKGPSPKPCGKCTNCIEITEGRSLAVLEIDGASHNSVDNVRDLIDSFRAAPPPGSTFKVYIIDEVHMLSTAAFNALLKSLEEPPANTVFILATTEVHKIPETVVSRCQQYHFKALTAQTVIKQLEYVVKKEKLEVDQEVLSMIARLSEGSMRDAQTLLDRVQSYCDNRITATEASEILGAVDRNVLFSLSQAVFSRNADSGLEAVSEAFQRGVDSSLLLKEFVSHFRELLIAKVGGEKRLEEIGVANGDITELLRQVQTESMADIQDLLDIARSGADSAIRSNYPRYALESLVVRMATREKVQDFAKLIGGMKAILKSGKGLTARHAPAAQSEEPKVSKVASRTIGKQNQKETKPATKKNFELDWNEFVKFASQSSGTLMLVEQLKLLRPEEFKTGLLQVQGPDLCLSYFQKTDNLNKLQVILNEFRPAKWEVILVSSQSAGRAVKGSILEIEKSSREKHVKTQAENLSSHPSVASLKKFFPGSTVEKIKVKNFD